MTDCPARAQLRRLLNGELPADVEGDISAHLETCAGCQQVLEELTDIHAAGSPSGGPAARVSDSQLQRLRGLLPPGSRPSVEVPAPTAAVPWPAVSGYEVLRELGRGGMAVVYEARQLRPNRLVALKMIRAGELATPEQMVRFCAEGELVARLRHPNIVQIYEVGSHDRRPYLALELMEGGNLSQALGGKPLPARAAAELVEVLAGATDYAHRQGVIHRDLNPANVLLSFRADSSCRETINRESVPKITDFGLAKHLGQDSRLTQTGYVMGTPGYMAPEQVRGENDRVGPATDVYALGAILYECLTGRPPFLAATPLETMRQVAELDPVPPARLLPQVPRDLEVICLKCLEKDAPRRYAGAGELADELARFLAGEPIRARRIDTPERAWRWARRRPAVAGLLLALAVTLLAGTGLSTYFAVEARRRADDARQKAGDATEARDAARAAQERADRQAADLLLLDRGLKLAHEGRVAEALHWMLASLRASPDPDFRRCARAHLASWGARAPTLVHWLDTPAGAAAFDPEGQVLVTTGKAGAGDVDDPVRLALWDARTGRPLGEPTQIEDQCLWSVAFSPNGKTLLFGNGTIQNYQGKPGWATRWDVAGRRPVGRTGGHADCVMAVGWAPDGRGFFTSSHDGTVRAWDADGRPVGRPLPHPDEVRKLVCSPDGRWLLVLIPAAAHLWDVASGEPIGAPIGVAGDVAKDVAFADGGQTILVTTLKPGAVGYRLLAQRFDPAARRLLGEPQVMPDPGGGELTAFPDGRAVLGADASRDGHLFLRRGEGVQVWRSARAGSRPLTELLPAARPAAAGPLMLAARFVPAGGRVWVPIRGTDWVQAWDMATGQPVGAPVPHQPLYGTTRLAASPDGHLVATFPPQPDTGNSGTVQVWHADTGLPDGPPLEHINTALALAFSPNGATLATGGYFHSVHLWDVSTGQLTGKRLPQGNIIRALDFSPDGTTLAVGLWERVVRLWDVAGQEPTLAPLQHDDELAQVRFGPDGTRLLAVCLRAAHLWDPRTGRKVGTLPFARPGIQGRVLVDPQGLFSPDGRAVLTSGGYGSFRLWDAATGQPLGPPTPPGETQLSCFAFSPDSRLVVAGHEDGTAQVWDVATVRPLGAPAVQPLGVTGVAFAVDGGSFRTVAADGTIRSWPVPAPLDGDDERVVQSVQLSTGLRLDEGRTVVPLTRPEWEELRRRWREREGDADWAISPPAADEEWHEARARDAEETGHAFTARWHLDRLIAARPDDGRLYLRRARTATDEGHWDEAAADYARARRHGPAEDVMAWYHHRAWACQARGQWSAALWYLDRLLAAQPDDEELRRRRADVSARVAAK